MLTGEGGGCGGQGGLIVDIRRWGGVIQKNESPDFRFSGVDISVYLSYRKLMESEAIY